MTIMASVSRAVQEPAALAVPVTGRAPAGRSLIARVPNSGMYAPPTDLATDAGHLVQGHWRGSCGL